MKLETECINRLLDTIKVALLTAYLVTNTETNYASLLGQSASSLTSASNPTTQTATWGSASAEVVTTTNNATSGNAFNYSIKAGVTANAIAFVSASNMITAIINLSSPKTGAATYGSGLYINKIEVTMTESA